MTCKLIHFAFVVAVLLLRAGASAAEVAPAAVFLHEGEVCTLDERAPMRCLTDDGAAKSAPKWAPDGHRIAYVQLSGVHGMFARVVVLDEQGSVQQRMPIGAIGPGHEIYSLMTAVAGARWLGPRRLVVEGHLNPSDTEYVMFDAETGATVAELGDQGLGAGFSPDGLHWAAVSGVPHFSSPAATTPTLEIDAREVLVLGGGEESFATPPQWSRDAGRVALLIRHGADGAVTKLALARAAVGDAQVFALPFHEQRVELHWCGDDPCVMRQVPDHAPRIALPGIRPLRAQWWRLHDGAWASMPAPVRAAATNAALAARRAALARRLGAVDVDLREVP